MRVGLVGLGLMGSAMAPNLIKAGHSVIGFDVDPGRRAEHLDRGGEIAESAGAVAASSEVVILSLPTSGVVREVCLSAGGLAEGLPGLVIDTTTARPEDTLETAGLLAAKNIHFLDATMSGNARQAVDRDVVAMVGGSAADFAESRPILEAIARSVHHVDPVGTGARTKLIVNLVLGVHRMVLAEGLVMGEMAGLNLDALLDVLKDGAAYSRAMDVWGDQMVAGDHLPPVSRIRQSHKDFRLVLEQGEMVGSPTWLASVVRQLLAIGETTGLGDADNSAVVEILRRQAGIGRM